MSSADKVIECCRALAQFTEEPGRTTRTFLSPPMRDVHRILTMWMEQVGMRVSVDAAGNLRGMRGSGAKPLLIGSHLDTVPDAGAFDGILGVVLGIALVEALGNRAPKLSIEVIGFSEEEGVRFGVPFIGSRALAGTLDLENMDKRMSDAIREFGLDPAELPSARLAGDSVGYLEFHIEQGPVLDRMNLGLGIVDGIVGQSRLSFEFRGNANHAGTTPMAMRHDALAAAGEWICRVETLARDGGVVATVGSIQVEPNAGNVIPGVARLTLDVRHECDEKRGSAARAMVDAATEICERRGIRLKYEQKLDQAAVPMDEGMRGRLERAVESAGYPVHRMMSGAGHDAMILAGRIPVAMLFLRSPGGISHHPAESVLAEDVEAAIETGVRFVMDLETNHV